MRRISIKEKQYVLDVLKDEFHASNKGKYISRLEDKFAQIFDVKYAIALINGTATLHTALAACGLKPGDEVITTPLTMSCPGISIVQQGCIPVFADVDKDTFNISAESVLNKITRKTKAIMTVALYGLSPDYQAIAGICKKYKLYLIEDNAQGFLSKYKKRLAGTFGDFASFSFQATKQLTSGEGGMLITNKKELAQNARKFSRLGFSIANAEGKKPARKIMQDPLFARHQTLGFNYQMSGLQAAVALAQVERANKLVEARIKTARAFDRVIKKCSWLKPQGSPKGYKNTYWSYAVTMETERVEKNWHRFRDLFVKNGGEGVYAAWRLTYHEPFFANEVQKYPGVWQRYNTSLCPAAENLQKRMIQFKTNYWDFRQAQKQAEILRKTIKQFEKLYL